ncbi:ArdC family protein [Sphingomonas sp. Sphisp140]|uniref:ArdC family protein n=1 Tax=unclassified Sphingomonas TaxID=196159 RepID=UPI0039AE9D35
MGKGRRRGAGGKVGGDAARVSLYDEVTARIVAELEAGRFPWVQPWDSAVAAPGLPRNAVSHRAYSGINVLILWGEVIARGYASQGWLTFRQALEAGGCVRKGEHGVGVVYADRFTPEAEKERAAAEGGAARAVPFLKRFTVFNVAQCDGLPERMLAGAAPLPERELVPVAEALIAATAADFRIGGAEAYYSPGADYVQVPPQPAFRHQIDYYRTALHELGHWTGHASRLARDLSNPFGSAGYAREELVAELASAFLCAALGIVPSVRHADYLGSWLAVLRADNRAIFRAASLATKAADWLLACREPSEMEDAA